MTDSHPPEVQAPFDALPAPSPESVSSAPPASAKSGRGKAVLLLAALAVVAAGVGQAIGLSLLFGERDDRLSPPAPEIRAVAPPVEEPRPKAAPSGDEKEAEPTKSATEMHVLEVGRQRLAQGDVEGARRIAAQYLLRLDGLSHDDAERAPEACALLGDVLRYDFERAHGPSGSAPAAPSGEGGR